MTSQPEFSRETRRAAGSSRLRSKPGILNPGVPRITKIFPIAALAAPDVLEAFDRLDTHEIFRHLVTELALDTQPQRRTMGNLEHLVVHVVGENSLRMHRFCNVDALIVLTLGIADVHRIGAIKHQKACARLQTHALKHRATYRALPLSDATPTLDAVMAGNLGP